MNTELDAKLTRDLHWNIEAAVKIPADHGRRDIYAELLGDFVQPRKRI